MISAIEELLEYWGERSRQCGLGGGLSSQMGTIMEWKGGAPRGTPGSKIPGGGAGLDPLAHEVDAALASIERDGKVGGALFKLARLRYRVIPTPSVREQMRALNITEGALRTYHDRVHALHVRLEQVLIVRLALRKNKTARRRGLPQTCVKVASN